ncbi:hypothetical protein B5M09_007768 [Aphanomyces astaci]|uniref:DDE-1 domain-containing protein n=1 Tax=Aphanomyces astaci TaxID=112090 RepID=A0A425D4R0_APHAT|nr:hypothetical protein B5M09_007768 [Aphanomyces astaci]
MENEAPQAPPPRRPRGRPVLTGLHKARPKKFKYQNITYKKMEVIECVDTLGVAETLDRHFGHLRGPSRETTRKKIYKWLKQRKIIQEKAADRRTANLKCSRTNGVGTSLPHEAEEQLAKWVASMRKDGVPVTPHMLQLMALETAIDLELPTTLSMLAGTGRVGQDTQGDGEAALAAFVQRVQAVVVEHGIDVIYNADQTGVNYEYLPAKTMQSKRDKTVWIKCGGKTKDLATAMLLANSNGDKLPMFLVLKTTASKVNSVVQEKLTQRHGFGKQVWKQVEPLQARFNCRLYGNPITWWNSDISVAFLKSHFENRPDRSTKKVLLLWDNFSTHFTDEVVECARELNVVLEKVPPRFTWIC